MKQNRTSTFTIFLAILAMVAFAVSSAFASTVDFYLKLDNGKGVTKIVRCSSNDCVLSDLPAGTYMFSVCDKTGKDCPVEAEFTYEVRTAREASSGMATGRQAGSGIATGKRQHKPIRISTSYDKTASSNKITIDEPGSSFSCKTFVLPHVLESTR